MKNILIIIYTYNAVSIRRFLILAKALREDGYAPIFLDLDGGLADAIVGLAKSNGLEPTPDILSFPSYQSGILAQQALKITRQMVNIEDGGRSDSLNSDDDWLSILFRSLGIDPMMLLNGHVDNMMCQFIYELLVAEKLFNEHQPACVIYDIEIVATTRSLLYAARENKIPTLSMQHGEGNAEQYKKLPILADAYIAYSPYNVEKLREMKVPSDRVFLTGSPDTELLLKHDAGLLALELADRFSINVEKTIIVLSLKPNVGDFFIKINYLIVEAIRQVFTPDDEFAIILKQHPTDLQYNVPLAMLQQYFVDETLAMSVVPGDFPISKLFTVSDYVITPLSFAIVEAVMLDNFVIVVEEDNPPIWPDWNHFNAFEMVSLEQLTVVLEEIKSGSYASLHHEIKSHRDEFVYYFRYKEDSLATRRICDVVTQLTS